jgi:hypothetical protein
MEIHKTKELVSWEEFRNFFLRMPSKNRDAVGLLYETPLPRTVVYVATANREALAAISREFTLQRTRDPIALSNVEAEWGSLGDRSFFDV